MTPSAMPQKSGPVATRSVGHLSASDGPQTGSDLSPGQKELVLCTRLGNPPLRFKGRRIARHWAAMSEGVVIEVELWERIKKQLVVSYSTVVGKQIVSTAVQVSDLAAAASYLEDVCAGHTETTAATLPWAEAHLFLCFRQHFDRLIADVLDDWQSLPTLQERA